MKRRSIVDLNDGKGRGDMGGRKWHVMQSKNPVVRWRWTQLIAESGITHCTALQGHTTTLEYIWSYGTYAGW